jgi:hypothetical protein
VVAATSSCGQALCQKNGRLSRSQHFEEPMSTSHLQARVGPCIIVVLDISLSLFSKLGHFIMLNYVVKLRTYCNNSHYVDLCM